MVYSTKTKMKTKMQSQLMGDVSRMSWRIIAKPVTSRPRSTSKANSTRHPQKPFLIDHPG